jgi:hypothetical protein
MSVRVRSRRLVPLVAGVLLAALAATPVAAQSPSPAGSSPAASPLPPTYPWDDAGAQPAAPTPGAITDPQPVGWDHVAVWPDGRTLTVYFWNGAEACYGLDRIELTETGAGLQVTPYVGFRVDASNVRCAAVMQLYATIVELPQRILGGGDPQAVGGRVEPGQPIVAGAQLSMMEPQPWDAVTVAGDGVTGTVHFTGGVEECFGLGRVDTPVQDGLQQVIVYTGPIVDPADGPRVCVAMAVFYWTPVTLPAPLLLGGAA